MAQEKLAKTAKEFSTQLQQFAINSGKDIEDVIRWSILGLHANIIKRSPVDTGVYRASHGIATGMAPSDYAENFVGTKAAAGTFSRQRALAWRWYLGDGNIVLYNNAPYAEVLEFGGYPDPPKGGKGKTIGGFSKQAPQGVYTVALAEFAQIFAKAALDRGL